jgi:hypothetical protein
MVITDMTSKLKKIVSLFLAVLLCTETGEDRPVPNSGLESLF